MTGGCASCMVWSLAAIAKFELQFMIQNINIGLE